MLDILKNREGTYCVVVKSDQGHTLLESISLKERKEAEKLAGHIRHLAGNPSNFERTTEHSGHFRFTLKGPDGNILGRSLPYQSEAGMENGIKNTLARIARGLSEG